MKKITTIVGRRKSLIGLIGLMGLLASCSVEEEQPQSTSAPIELTSYVTGFGEAQKANESNEPNESRVVTRGWVPPVDPSNGNGERYQFFENKDLPISVFFTQKAADPEGGYEEEFFFKSAGKWRVSTDLTGGTIYYLYGYIPHDLSINASVSKLTGDGKTYEDGAVLTLENLPTATSSDLCVIIGAKNGKNDYDADADFSVSGLRRGSFDYTAAATSKDASSDNYVYLLFDHLYAAMRFKMRVQGDYAALRTIKLKDLSLEAYSNGTQKKKKMDAVITLSATGSESIDPIRSIEFTEHPGAETASSSFYTSESGEVLTTDFKDFQVSFMPVGVNKLDLISTYDVYDNKGNLVRENCKARNTLDITKLFDRETETKRGYRYTVNMTIQPTYLYVLSEPDLDNPTVTIE